MIISLRCRHPEYEKKNPTFKPRPETKNIANTAIALGGISFK